MNFGIVILFFGLPFASSMLRRLPVPACRATGITAYCHNIKFDSYRIEAAMNKAMEIYRNFLPESRAKENLFYIGHSAENGHEFCYPLTMTKKEIKKTPGIQAYVYFNQVCRFMTVMEMFTNGQFPTHTDCDITRN